MSWDSFFWFRPIFLCFFSMIFRCFKTQKPAHGAVQDADCHMSLWSQWSPCSSPCHGIRQRVRRIAALAQGNGKSCDPFGRHLGDTLMGWRWGKSWENLGRVYEHVHHIFIICSSYVHQCCVAALTFRFFRVLRPFTLIVLIFRGFSPCITVLRELPLSLCHYCSLWFQKVFVMDRPFIFIKILRSTKAEAWPLNLLSRNHQVCICVYLSLLQSHAKSWILQSWSLRCPFLASLYWGLSSIIHHNPS